MFFFVINICYSTVDTYINVSKHLFLQNPYLYVGIEQDYQNVRYYKSTFWNGASAITQLLYNIQLL